MQQGLKCLPAMYLSLNSCFEGVHMSLARGIIRIFPGYMRGREFVAVLSAVIRTVTVFPVTSLVILNEFCLPLFVLTIIIKRFKRV